jgi:hypothetical protein
MQSLAQEACYCCCCCCQSYPFFLGPKTQPDNEIVRSFGAEERLLTIRAEEVSETLPIFFNVKRTTLQDPPAHVMKKCRKFCCMLKDIGRKDIVEALRLTLPAGMTGEYK